MRFFLTDDDPAVRAMLAQIIDEEDLGVIVGEAEDGAYLDSRLLTTKEVDILLIDLLMPLRDGIETVRQIGDSFQGMIVMISQVESKEMIGQAYSLGIEYYITKPINRQEVIGVLYKVIERLKLQKSIHEIKRSLAGLGIDQTQESRSQPLTAKNIHTTGNFLLSELGMIGEAGCKDLLDLLEVLFSYEKENTLDQGFPSLQNLFYQIAEKKALSPEAWKKEVKAAEQRVRRAISQALNHLASLGLTDYSNPKFEHYASRFFDFMEVRKKMLEIENEIDPAQSNVRLNIKKFVQVLYLEAKQLTG